MLLWLGFKALQQAIQLESGLARGGQKSNISFDLLQRGQSKNERTESGPVAPQNVLFATNCLRWRRCMAGLFACWLDGLEGLAGWLGLLVCRVVRLAGWRVGWGWQCKTFLVSICVHIILIPIHTN